MVLHRSRSAIARMITTRFQHATVPRGAFGVLNALASVLMTNPRRSRYRAVVLRSQLRGQMRHRTSKTTCHRVLDYVSRARFTRVRATIERDWCCLKMPEPGVLASNRKKLNSSHAVERCASCLALRADSSKAKKRRSCSSTHQQLQPLSGREARESSSTWIALGNGVRCDRFTTCHDRFS